MGGSDFPCHSTPSPLERPTPGPVASPRRLQPTRGTNPQSSIPKSNLDHVVAAEHLKFQSFGGDQIKVRGWPEKGNRLSGREVDC